MRRFWLAGIVLGISALGSVQAGAQQPTTSEPGQQRPQRRGGPFLMPASIINIIAPLSDVQKDKITAAQQKLTADLKAAAGDREKIQAAVQAANEQNSAILNDDQKAAVRREFRTLSVINRAVPLQMLGEVGFTAQEYEKVKAPAADAVAAMRKLAPEERREKGRALSADLRDKVLATLTDDQKAKLTKLMAERRARRANRPAAPGTAPAAP